MTITSINTYRTTQHPPLPDPPPFAPWVDSQEETWRGGLRQTLAVNQRTGHAVYCTADDLAVALSAARDVSETVLELRSGGYLAGTPDPGPAAARLRQRGDGLVWWSADRSVTRAHDRLLHHLFTRPGVAAQVAFGTLGLVLFVKVVLATPVQLRASPMHIPVIIVLGLVAVSIHELGHALVTVHYGRRVRAVGLRLHLGCPTFYVDSVEALLLSRRQRLLQVAAGPWAEWLATTIAVVALAVVPDDGSVAFVLHRFVVVNTIGIVTNLLPFVGLDGSLILSDVVREPDLAARSRDALNGTAPRERWLVGYAMANALVAGVLLVSSGYFWYELFGGLIEAVWAAGPGGMLLVAVVAVLVARSGWTSAQSMIPMIGSVRSRLAFRLERRWRVSAIRSLCAVPEIAALDAASLGILAGRLRRVPSTAPVVAGELVIDRRGGRIVLPADWSRFLGPR
jgi:Zn-dependent protease